MVYQSFFPRNRTEHQTAATTVLALVAATTTDPKVHGLLVLWVQSLAQGLIDARAAHRAAQGVWRARYDELAPLDREADGALRLAEVAIFNKLGAAGVALFHRLLGVSKLSDVTGGPLAQQVRLVEDMRGRVEAEPDLHGLPQARLEEVFATNAALCAGITAEQEAKRAWKASSAALSAAEDAFGDGYRVFVRSVVQLLREDGAAALLPRFSRGAAKATDAAAPSAEQADDDGAEADDTDDADDAPLG